MAAGFLYARCGKKKLDLAAYTDMVAPAVPLFHMFGRIGCFLGGCCYGVESDFGFVFEHSLVEAANGVRRFPVQLVEAGFNLLLFAVLAWLLKKGVCKGKLFLLYLLAYSVGRFVLEFWRGDAYRGFLFGVSTSQLISIFLFAVAGCILLWQWLRSRRRMQPDVGRVKPKACNALKKAPGGGLFLVSGKHAVQWQERSRAVSRKTAYASIAFAFPMIQPVSAIQKNRHFSCGTV